MVPVELSLGGLRTSATCKLDDYTDPNDPYSKDIAGVLCTGVYGQGPVGLSSNLKGRVTLDFHTNRMTVDVDPKRARYRPRRGSSSFSFHYKKHKPPVPFVRLKVGDAYHDFAVDTGLPASIGVPSYVFEKLPLNKRTNTRALSLTLGGYAGTFAWDAEVHPQAPDNYLLGMGLLRMFRVTIDYRDMMLYLEPPG
jgi:predicted aspartyl protease